MAFKMAVSRSIVPACDGDFKRFLEIVEATARLEQVGAYKIGAALALTRGLKATVDAARERTTKPLIYDHQKAGTDIPDTAESFMATLVDAGIDAVILFPLSGPDTQVEWTAQAQNAGLGVIIGGHMTHPQYLSSEGGYISPEAVERIFSTAIGQGVKNFVVPGNKPDVIRRIRSKVSSQSDDVSFFAPGFIAQKGQLSEAAQVAGPRWHAIVGRALYEASDIRREAEGLASHLS